MRERPTTVAVILAALALAFFPACGRKTPVKPPTLAAPEAIDDLVAINAKDGIRLTWRRPVHYADGARMADLGAFRIERSVPDGEFTQIATVALSDQARFQQERRFHWVDSDTTMGMMYQYRVYSVTTDDYVSRPSNIVTLERAEPSPLPTHTQTASPTAPAATPTP
jgi:hypothetical protein